MKRSLLWIIIAVLAGVASFCCMRWRQPAMQDHLAIGHGMPGLLWLRDEFKLNEAQMAKVSAVHEAYRPKCEAMCERIEVSHVRIEVLTAKSKELTPELAVALKENSELYLECQRAMLWDLYETAAAMDARQGRRYLDLVLPYAVDFSHSEKSCPYCRANQPGSDGTK